MEPNTLKKSKRKVNRPARFQQTPEETDEDSTPVHGEGADGLQSASRRLDVNQVAAPVNVSSGDKADFASGGSKTRAQHGPNESEPAMVTSGEAHHVLEYMRGPGNLGLNFEYNIMVIRQLEREGLIVPQFREKLLTWFCVRATEQHRRVVNAFIKTLKDDRRSLAGQLVHTFGGIIEADQ